MLYNVLQVCHGGHSLQLLYVRVRSLTNREWKGAKKCGVGEGKTGEEEKEQGIELTAFLLAGTHLLPKASFWLLREEKRRKGTIWWCNIIIKYKMRNA
jgi:hypothetical protein